MTFFKVNRSYKELTLSRGDINLPYTLKKTLFMENLPCPFKSFLDKLNGFSPNEQQHGVFPTNRVFPSRRKYFESASLLVFFVVFVTFALRCFRNDLMITFVKCGLKASTNLSGMLIWFLLFSY